MAEDRVRPSPDDSQPALAAAEIPRASLVDVITARLRSDLVTGAIEPGQPMRVAGLERRFGVSHIPIREALRRLEADGLVVGFPQRGVVAASVSRDEIAEIWDLRRMVEGPVVRRATEGAAAPDREAVDRALETLRDATAEDTRSVAFREAHSAFHGALLRRGSTPWIDDLLRRLWQGSERYIGLFASLGELDPAEFMRAHEVLADAYRAGDGDALAALLVAHISTTEQEVRAGFERAADHDL